jgi:hypothetical protein
MMNAFTQDDFKGAYNSTSMQQLRSLADHGHAEARELLALEALGLPNNQLSLFARLSRWFWVYTEGVYESWRKNNQNIGI